MEHFAVAKIWWKIAAVILVIYTIVAGFLLDVPALPILNETIRNLYFHVTMWWGMMMLLSVSLVYSIRYLSGFKIDNDLMAGSFAHTAMLFGFLGLLTGMTWARFTWGAWWVSDPRLNGAAITLLIYLAYMILRNAIDDEHKRAKVAAVYNIFAFVMLIVFLLVIPRMTPDSLHPGYGGNPAFSSYDLDSTMRLVFYPSIFAWILLGVWIATLRVRYKKIERKLLMGD